MMYPNHSNTAMLTIETAGTGTGVVASSPDGINCDEAREHSPQQTCHRLDELG